MLNKALEDLARSGISGDHAERAEMFYTDNAKDEHRDFRSLPGLLIHYLDPETGEQMQSGDGPFLRVRYLNPPPSKSHRTSKVKPQRYSQPLGSDVKPYFPICDAVDWKTVLSDPTIPIVLTEGEKKALAASLTGMPTIGLGGVFNFLQDGELLPDLKRINWERRKVYINYDSDAATNPMILTAEARLASLLNGEYKAKIHLVRMSDTEDGDKVGIDDLIVAKGGKAWHEILSNTRVSTGLDVEVAKLNEDVAWIESEGLLWQMKENYAITKSNFKEGSAYASRTYVKSTEAGPKQMSVAQVWLRHPHALRFQSLVFDPSTTDRTICRPRGLPTYNLWEGWTTAEGDPTPFLDLYYYVFSLLPDELTDFVLKLMAYKFQNPERKIPLAIVLLGGQGGGKSMIADLFRQAAGDYGAKISSIALESEYNEWIERCLIGVFDEADPKNVAKGARILKELVSEPTVQLHAKYRGRKQISQYAHFFLTSNERGVGHYDADDRRMFVVNCPPKHPDGISFYMKIREWLHNSNGAPIICNYLLNYDLEGWEPPISAPMTDEKYIALIENSTPIQRLAEEMRTADQNMVKLWIDQANVSATQSLLSSDVAEQASAREVLDALSHIQVRPFYTQEELRMIFPMIASQFYGSSALAANSAGQVSKQLREAGVRYLRCKDDPKGFKYRGRYVHYLVVAEDESLPHAMTQQELETALKTYPQYKELTK